MRSKNKIINPYLFVLLKSLISQKIKGDFSLKLTIDDKFLFVEHTKMKSSFVDKVFSEGKKSRQNFDENTLTNLCKFLTIPFGYTSWNDFVKKESCDFSNSLPNKRYMDLKEDEQRAIRKTISNRIRILLKELDNIEDINNNFKYSENVLQIRRDNNKDLQKPFGTGLILFDVDDFTIINKIHGEEVGNKILFLIHNDIINNIIKINEIKTKNNWLGPDEYYIKLIADEKQTIKIANQILKNIYYYEWNTISKNLSVSVSICITTKAYSETTNDCFIRTFYGLREAKKKGKNCINIAPTPEIFPQKIKKTEEISYDIQDWTS